MELRKASEGLWFGGRLIGSYAGFYSLTDLVLFVKEDIGKDLNVHMVQRSERFRSLVRLLLGIELKESNKVASVLKDNGVYLRHRGGVYCDIRLFVIFYALSCDEAMADCVKKSFNI